MQKFKKAQARNQASIEKHLAEWRDEACSTESSSEDEENARKRDVYDEALRSAVSKLLSDYRDEGGNVEKSLSYLTDVFQSGGATCLICISSVKKTDPIWSCGVCFTFVHLGCILHWIRDSLSYKREKGVATLWACPKCRTEYAEEETPERYSCFCAQTTDPPYQAWLVPHSCGERCDKPLRPACGHRCVLLCHPGACPPCPKTVTIGCFCGRSSPRTRRCNAKDWSCGEICSRKLTTCVHLCAEECHPAATGCPPCSTIVSAACRCGDRVETRICGSAADWRCEKPCGLVFSCGVHACEGRCHRETGEDCGECPRASTRACPCGKKRYVGGSPCTAKQIPTCGDTCGKLLECGSHYCSMRCHQDRCGPCLEVVTKSCRCRAYTKEIACVKEFHCNKKCPRMRTCGNHACNRKCCDCLLRGTSNACEKLCDNTLNCQKHKCSAPCHRGPCYPCPRTNVIRCRCGGSALTVPCGRLKRPKPPSCNKLCKIPPVCHHPKRESHKCHYGACPPCRKICALVRKKCGHSCAALCHNKVWTKTRVASARVTNGACFGIAEKSRGAAGAGQLKTLPCPPCEVSVKITCYGAHETIPIPCHKAIPYSCERPCGRVLDCTNHTCEMPCHRPKTGGGGGGGYSSSVNEGNIDEEETPEFYDCPECERACSLPRPEGCSHSCGRRCHPGACYPCKQLVKVSCHCGINTLYRRCAQLQTVGLVASSKGGNSEKRKELLKCGNRCPKNYACGHRCANECHPGECPNSRSCAKRVKVWCACKRIRRELACAELTTSVDTTRLECDETCRGIARERERLRETEETKKREAEDAINRTEVERFERKFKPRRKHRERTRSMDHGRGRRGGGMCNSTITMVAIVFSVFSLVIAWAYFRSNRETQ